MLGILGLIFFFVCIFLASLCITEKSKPVSFSVWLCTLFFGSWALIVLVSETVGRFRYSPFSLGLAATILGAGGAGTVLRRRVTPAATLRRYQVGRSLREIFSSGPNRVLAVLWLGILAFGTAAAVTIPPLIHDVIAYHVPLVFEWVHQGRVGYSPHFAYHGNYFPHDVEILNGWAFLFTGRLGCLGLPQVFLSGVLWPLVIYTALRAFAIPRAGAFWGAFLASITPQVLEQMSNELVDVGYNAALLFSAVLLVSRVPLVQRTALVSGVTAGLAMGSKTIGVLGAAVLFAALLGRRFGRRGDGSGQEPILETAAQAAVWLAAAALAGGWTYAVNLLIHGNPVYPFSVHLGPFVFPSPDMRHMADWMISGGYGASPLRAAWAGLSKVGALLLGLPPFERIDHGQVAGYGPLHPVLLLLGGVFLLLNALHLGAKTVWASVPEKRALLKLLIVFLVTVVLFYVFWDHEMWQKVKIENASDGRYLLFFPFLIVLFFLQTLRLLPDTFRRLFAGAITAVAVLTALHLLQVARFKGWSDFKYVHVQGGTPYDFYYRTVPPMLMPDHRRYFTEIGPKESVIVVNHSFIKPFPFYWPDFTRHVYTATPWGPYQMDVEAWTLPPAVTEPVKTFIDRERRRQDGKQIFLWGTPPGAFDVGIPYIQALARQTGATVVVSLMDRLPVEGNPRWALLWREPQKYIAVYRIKASE